MTELLRRIEDAAPDPIRLSDEELAELRAYVQTHRKIPVTWSKVQRDPEYRRQHEARLADMRHLCFVRDYNQNLQQLKPVPTSADAAQTGPAQASTKSKRGRKPDTDPKQDAEIVKRWKAGHFKTYEALGLQMGMSNRAVKLAIDRERARAKRRT